MIRLIVITAFLFSMVSAGLVAVKARVQDMENRLASLQTGIKSDRTAIRVLKAEWSYLNDPVRLQRLADSHLHLVPAKSSQISSISALPFADGTVGPRVAGQPAPATIARPSAPEVASRRTAP